MARHKAPSNPFRAEAGLGGAFSIDPGVVRAEGDGQNVI
jgi:hypothetical protein